MSSDEAPTSRVRKPLLIGLGILLVIALVYLVLILPNRGGVDDVDQTQAVVGSEPAVVQSELPADDAGDAVEEPSEDARQPSFEVFNARDPFDQLVVDASSDPVGGTQDTAAPADGTAPVDTTPPGTTPPGTTPPGDAAPADGPAQTTMGTTTIRLDEVFSDDGSPRVLVQVNSDGYEAAEGETVAGSLTVLDVEGNCATMRFEDTRFILCEGEQIQK